MKKLFKLSLNTVLLAIFLSMLVLPMALIGTADYKEQSFVLSSQDSRNQDTEPAIKAADDPEADVPEDVRDMILRMEREYYQTQGVEFPQDIERDENQEQASLDDETQEDQENIVTENSSLE